MNNKTFLHRFGGYILSSILVIAVLLFLPMTPNFFATPKQYFLICGVILCLALWTVWVVTKKELIVEQSAINYPLIFFAVALILNLYVNREGWVEGLVGRGSLYIASAALAYFATTFSRSDKFLTRFIYTFIGSSTILAIFSLLHITVLYKLSTIPTYMASRTFTLTGNPLTTMVLLVIGAVVTYFFAARSLKGTGQYLGFAAATVQTITAVAYISLMLPGGELAPNLLPYLSSWAVTLDALKTPHAILFGTGLANFPQLFSAVKPLSLNAGPLWNIYPTSASSELLQLLATTGILGLGSFVLIFVSAITHRSHHTDSHKTILLLSVLSFIAFIFTPSTIPTTILYFLTVGLLVQSEEKTITLNTTGAMTIGTVAVILMIAGGYLSTRLLVAENHMYRAQKALEQNDGRTVYDQNIAAIGLVPAMTSYHLSYSQVNISLASAISDKKDLTEDERNQVTTLVQQGIREAKLAISLRPHDYHGWQNLGNIYRNLINVADGADQFAVASYAQAVSLDPADPALRVEYGGLLYQLAQSAKDKETQAQLLNNAVQQFVTSVQLKSDYANGYYNLSKTYEQLGNTTSAYAAMQKTVASLDPSSPDLAKATSDLEALKAKLPKASPSPTPSANSKESENSELSQPSPLPSPIDGGPIYVPSDSPVPTPSP